MSHPYTKEYYEGGGISNYKEYVDDPKFEHRADEIIRLFDEKRERTLKILDVGCAKGFLVQHLRANGVDAWGVDISEYAISQAPDAVKPYVQVADATKGLPFKDKEFDVVVSYEILEHVAEGDDQKVIDECMRVGMDQYHIIGCTEYDFGGDKTHINLKPFKYWTRKFPKIFIRRCNEEDAYII